LLVERAHITFANVTPDRVAIAIQVTNGGDQRSSPTLAQIMAAPLGAFVPWQPLAVLPVPALEPGQSFVVRTEAPRVAPAVLGPPDCVPPQRLLTAFGAEDSSPDQARTGTRRRTQTRQQGSQGLPVDLFEILGRKNQHWAGNLNIFVSGKAVERHLAQALRIYPGLVNVAMFIVGQGADAYAFSLSGDGAEWDAKLFDSGELRSLAIQPHACSCVRLREWIKVRQQTLMLLTLEPPRHCARGTMAVEVTQRSTGKTATVEFSLDPEAAGPGCYVV
jgi:hypothetical protein